MIPAAPSLSGSPAGTTVLGPCREVCERFSGGPWQILTGVWARRPALEEHKIRMLQEPGEATCSPGKATAVRWEK